MYSEDIIQRYCKSRNPDERRVAMVMIGKARYHHLLDTVISVLIHDLDSEVRAMAAWSLDLLGNVDAIPVLIDALYDSSFGVRSNAGWALVHMAKRVMPLLVLADVIEVLQDKEHDNAREMAYLVLTNIDHEAAREAIKQYW